MTSAASFVFRVLAGALLAAALGVLVDALLGTQGWWLWGICAGAIGGALASYFWATEPAAPTPQTIRRKKVR